MKVLGRAGAAIGFLVCSMVGVSALATQLAGCGCSEVGCYNPKQVSGTLDLPVSTPAHLDVHACVNEVCDDAVISSDDIEPGQLGVSTVFDLGQVSITSERNATNWRLVLDVTADLPYEDGDVYTLRVTDTDTGKVLVDYEETVEAYWGGSVDNGFLCSSSSCEGIDLRFDQ